MVDTGDEGWVDEAGCLHLLGRRGLVGSVGGVRVDVLEVEAVLSQHPGLEGAVVVQMREDGAQSGVRCALRVCFDSKVDRHVVYDVQLRLYSYCCLKLYPFFVYVLPVLCVFQCVLYITIHHQPNQTCCTRCCYWPLKKRTHMKRMPSPQVPNPQIQLPTKICLQCSVPLHPSRLLCTRTVPHASPPQHAQCSSWQFASRLVSQLARLIEQPVLRWRVRGWKAGRGCMQ